MQAGRRRHNSFQQDPNLKLVSEKQICTGKLRASCLEPLNPNQSKNSEAMLPKDPCFQHGTVLAEVLIAAVVTGGISRPRLPLFSSDLEVRALYPWRMTALQNLRAMPAWFLELVQEANPRVMQPEWHTVDCPGRFADVFEQYSGCCRLSSMCEKDGVCQPSWHVHLACHAVNFLYDFSVLDRLAARFCISMFATMPRMTS